MGIGDIVTGLGSRKGKAAAIGSGFVVIGVTAGVLVATNGGPAGTSDCDDGETVSIAADPTIAPAVDKIVHSSELSVDSSCIDVQVRSAPSAVVQARLTQDAPDPQRPDIWIPDSTVWPALADDSTADAQSVASSPIVLATDESTAQDAGWPQTVPRWSKVFAGSGKVGAPPPTKQTATMLALTGIDHLGLAPVKANQTAVAMARNPIDAGEKAFAHLPDGGANPSVAAFPSSEQAMLTYNKNAKSKAVAAYPDGQTPWLNYPAAVLDNKDPKRVKAANAVRNALLTKHGEQMFADAGFRTPDGKLTGKAAADNHIQADAGRPGKPPTEADGTKLLQRWATSAQNARLLVAVDTSSSMAEPVPGTKLNRAQATLKTVAEGLRLLREDSVISLWEFSGDATGEKQPYREIAPAKTVREQVASGLPNKVGSVVAKPAGSTPLYDTTLAAVADAREHWNPEALNVVVILTDGENSYKPGLKRADFLTQLRPLMSPQKPIGLVFVGLGDDVDDKDLKSIAKTVHGQALFTSDIRQTKQLYFKALRGFAEMK